MQYFVYILYSLSLNVYYKGFSQNVDQRLASHLIGESFFTSRANDWLIVYKKAFETKKEALIEEKRLNPNSTENPYFYYSTYFVIL